MLLYIIFNATEGRHSKDSCKLLIRKKNSSRADRCSVIVWDWSRQWKLCWSGHGQKVASWSSKLHSKLLKLPSAMQCSILGQSISISAGLTEAKRARPWRGWKEQLSIAIEVLPELFSLRLLHEASVSLLRLIGSDVSLPLRAKICTILACIQSNQIKLLDDEVVEKEWSTN